MRKLTKYKPKNTDDVLVVKNGVTYRVLDLGGSKIEIRVKTPKEVLKDKKAFNKYLSGRDGDTILP